MFSVVIITKNEAHIIGKVLGSLSGLSDDIVIVDSGSTDGTVEVCDRSGARVIHHIWKGYGEAKNTGNQAARHDWILSVDADEVLNDELRSSLQNVDLNDRSAVYRFRRLNFFSGKLMRHGVWSNDFPTRLFNRQVAAWNLDEVHEGLDFNMQVRSVRLKGSLFHYTAEDPASYRKKMAKYARLNAEKYHRRGKRSGPIKKYLSPLFSFIKFYFFRLGFLDGSQGLQICLIQSRYIHDKYTLLEQLNRQKVGRGT